jgi:hypothetical protein
MAEIHVVDKNGTAYIGDKILIHFYGSGDVDTAKALPADDDERKLLHGALYDFLQTTEMKLETGDAFVLADGTRFAEVDGFHVVMLDQTPLPKI